MEQVVAQMISDSIGPNPEREVKICIPDHQETIVLPGVIVGTLMEVLSQMAAGNAVSVVPVKPVMGVREGADILNVSPLYLTSLLDAGRIPFTGSGRRRKISFVDLKQYQREIEEEQQNALEALTVEAQALGMYRS